jgi:hypothetical protein
VEAVEWAFKVKDLALQAVVTHLLRALAVITAIHLGLDGLATRTVTAVSVERAQAMLQNRTVILVKTNGQVLHGPVDKTTLREQTTAEALVDLEPHLVAVTVAQEPLELLGHLAEETHRLTQTHN